MIRIPAAALLLAAGPAAAADPAAGLVLKFVLAKDAVAWSAGKEPKEFRQELDDLAERQKKMEEVTPPQPPALAGTLQIVNAGKGAVTIYVEGDVNVATFDLTGPGVAALATHNSFTADYRLPKEVTLEPGKAFEIPVKALADGFRGAGRYVYYTELGEYELKASYRLGGADGGKGPVLTSESVKFKVTAKK